MRQNVRYIMGFATLGIGLIVMLYWNMNTGSVHLSFSKLVDLLRMGNDGSLEGNILWKIRLPRLLGVMILGGGLAIAGFLMQTFFKNPIAGPFSLGISSGAKLFVGFFMLSAIPFTGGNFSPYMIFGAAFVGAFMAMMLVLLVSGKVQNISMLLVVGMMIGYICSAGTDCMITFAESNQLKNFTIWSMGSFSGITWDILKAATIIILSTVALVFLLSKPLNAYLLGENYAKSMGVNIRAFRILLITLSSVLAACVTAFAGPISFVGIAVPHITRMTFKTSSPKVLIPATFFMGSCFCLLCDLIARTIFSPTEMAISTITSVLGAPIVIGMIIKQKGRV